MNFQFVLSCLYFFLPAYFTNMTPPLAKKLGILDCLGKPVDFGKRLREKCIFGPHKTWRGIVAGLTVGLLIVYLQSWLYQFPSVQNICFFNYHEINLLFFGFLLCGGALFGDLISAFFKRRLGLKPGTKFVPFDQINYVIGSAIFLTLFLKIDILVWPTLLALTFFLHIIINRLGYNLNLHRAKW